MEEEKGGTLWHRIIQRLNLMHPDVWAILILMGFLAAVFGFIVDFISSILHNAHVLFATTDSGFVNFTIWILFSLFFAAMAASVGKWIAIDAEGSGIPEMKAILAGVNIYRYLGFQTFVGKILGVISANAAGLSIGKEGPFVHISGIIANKL